MPTRSGFIPDAEKTKTVVRGAKYAVGIHALSTENNDSLIE
jgi:hypothetical protein